MEGETELGLLVKNTLDAIELPRLELRQLAPAQMLRQLGRMLNNVHGSVA